MLRLQFHGSRNKIGASDKTQLLYLLAEVRPAAEYVGQRLPLNIALVIDRSTSMKGDRLAQVKTAATALIQKLAPEDIVSIVTFSDRAELVLPAGRVQSRVQLEAQIQGIQASGGTEIYQGLVTAVKQLLQAPPSQYLNHLILLTDGHTYGDDASCLELAAKAAERDIGISAFGIGMEWNDQFLDQLVALSGGRSSYIESPEQVINQLQERIEGLGSIFAHNLRLRLDFPDNIQLNDAFKVAPFAQPLSATGHELQLGTIEGTSPVSILLELTVQARVPGEVLKLPFQFVVDIPSQQQRDYRFGDEYRVLTLPHSVELEPPPAIIEAVRILNLHRMHERIWDEVEAGQVTLATQRMERLTARLAEAGFDDLAEQARLETQRLSSVGTMSLEGRKKIKYGTRSLLTQSLTLDTIRLSEK